MTVPTPDRRKPASLIAVPPIGGGMANVGDASSAPGPRSAEAHTLDTVWQSLVTFSVYRLALVVILAITYWSFSRLQVVGSASPLLAGTVMIGYFVAAVAALASAKVRFPMPIVHLSAQVAVDVIGLTLLMHASGGARSGIGLLLLVTLAAAGLVSRGRMAYFHAALAALAVLMEQAWQFLYLDANGSDFVASGLLASSYFVIAGLGYTLAKYATGAEKIAAERSIDLANLAQINQLVIRDMQDGFVVVDEQDIIRQLNPQSVAMVGGLKNAVNRPLADCAPALAVLLQEWRRDRARIFPMVRDVTTQKDYQVRLVAIGEQLLSPTVVFIEDAGRIRAQAQQMKLVALGRLTASIAHEIRNPLSSINHAAELLGEDAERSEADARLLTIIQQNSHRLDRMVQEVLYLNRRDRAHPEQVDPRVYLEQFLRDFCSNEKVEADIIRLQAPSGHRLVFDRSHLDQVLWNLTRNAVRHGRKQAGSVSLELSKRADTATLAITVTDDGPGVSIEALPHLFEPFFTTDSQGTGLGLYIAQELAEVNGARIEYLLPDEFAASRGACFRITFNRQ